MKFDVSILIQGPLDKTSLDNIRNYRNYGRIYLSCWTDSDFSLIKNINGIHLVSTNWSQVYGGGYNQQNILRQIISSLRGLELVKTLYTVKVRSDEYYEDLSYFIEKMKQNPNKLVTNNVFFRPDKGRKFHFSDHVIGGLTIEIRRMFECCRIFCENINWDGKTLENDEIGIPHLGKISPEMLLCLSYLIGYNLKINPSDSIKIMKRHIDVVSIEKMGKFLARCNYAKKQYDSQEMLLQDETGVSITCMEEL